jgi:DNA-binding CsgD family transcriptional regulator
MKKNTKADPLSLLSRREREVLKLVVEGRTSKEIAVLIGVKPSSIHTYRSRIMGKLEIEDIASLVRLAIRHGVIRA